MPWNFSLVQLNPALVSRYSPIVVLQEHSPIAAAKIIKNFMPVRYHNGMVLESINLGNLKQLLIRRSGVRDAGEIRR